MVSRFLHPYAEFLDAVEKPTRYIGGEYQEVRKDPADVPARVCLAFPDVYEIGMSHLGTKILYSLLNTRAGHRLRARLRALARHGRRSCARAACRC